VTRVLIRAPGTDAARVAAEEIAALLRRKPAATLVLASGKTMVPVYRELVRLHRAGRARFRRATTFNLDELAVAADDPRSFRAFMERRLFSRVDLPPGRVHFLRGNAKDRAAECERYEEELAAAGPPDLALVGIGANGHVAYLEPGASLAPRTAAVRLSAATRRSLAADGVVPVPAAALTMGIESILAARSILLVAAGAAKAEAVAVALEGPVTARCPASFLTVHPSLTVVLDVAAARALSPPGRRSPRPLRRASRMPRRSTRGSR
jgi:glucosamine-6-phosphate deaminase